METKSCEKVATKFYCITCDYYTSRKSSYDKNIITLKHSELTKGNTKVAHLIMIMNSCVIFAINYLSLELEYGNIRKFVLQNNQLTTKKLSFIKNIFYLTQKL